MRAGRMRFRLRFEQPVKLRNETGEVIVDSWALAFETWGDVEPLSGREYLSASEFRAGISTRMSIRWRAGVDASMRIIHEGATYNIDTILPVKGRRKEIQILCGTGVITDGGSP